MWCFFSKPSLCRWLAWFSCLHLGDFQLHSSAVLGHLLLAHLCTELLAHQAVLHEHTLLAAGVMSAHLLVCPETNVFSSSPITVIISFSSNAILYWEEQNPLEDPSANCH